MTDAEESLLSLASCHSPVSIPRHFSPPPRHSSPPTSGEAEAGLLPRVPPPPKKCHLIFCPLSPDSSGSYPSSTLLLRDDLKEARRDLLLKKFTALQHTVQCTSHTAHCPHCTQCTPASWIFPAPGSSPLPPVKV